MNLRSLGAKAPWPAPAKLNLCLHIVGRRADGYHLLQSAIQFIDLCDWLRFYQRPAGIIERIGGPADVPADQDLVIRAAHLLLRESGVAAGMVGGVAIDLQKEIPMQAGLGGGSSDAATTLVALNRLWQLNWSVDRLAELGLKLGADVPVFIRGQAAWVEGVGEVLQPADYPESTFLVIKPTAAVSTGSIFCAPELTRNTPITTIRAFRESGGHNDCTATVRARYPEVAQALDWLDKHGNAKLTGTGACVFAEFENREQARQVFALLSRRLSGEPVGWHGYVVQGLNRSPLLTRLAAEDEQGDE